MISIETPISVGEFFSEKVFSWILGLEFWWMDNSKLMEVLRTDAILIVAVLHNYRLEFFEQSQNWEFCPLANHSRKILLLFVASKDRWYQKSKSSLKFVSSWFFSRTMFSKTSGLFSSISVSMKVLQLIGESSTAKLSTKMLAWQCCW